MVTSACVRALRCIYIRNDRLSSQRDDDDDDGCGKDDYVMINGNPPPPSFLQYDMIQSLW